MDKDTLKNFDIKAEIFIFVDTLTIYILNKVRRKNGTSTITED